MTASFDQTVDRRKIFNRNQWNWYAEDVLPLWLADMNFRTPQPILDALQAALEHGILGYELASPALLERVAARLEKLYHWQVAPESIVPVPGVEAGVHIAASIFCQPGQGILLQPPVFQHFIQFPQAYGLVRQDAPLARGEQGSLLSYFVDFEGFRQAIHSGGSETGMFLLCNPNNPTGQIYPADELAALAQLCLDQKILICSDEIHNELLLDGASFTPLAAHSAAIAENTITLFGPGKTFNCSGLNCAFAVIPNAELRQPFTAELERLAVNVNSLGLVATGAAYSGACDDWLVELRAYLSANRDFMVDFLAGELPDLRFTRPAATYLAWIDCSAYIQGGQISGSPQEFFLEKGKLALSDGALYGPGGEGFVRLNFACPRAMLEDALDRMKRALTGSAGRYLPIT